MTHRLPFLVAGTSLILLLGLGMGPCAADFELGVGAFEIGPGSAILWTRAVPAGDRNGSVVVWAEVATDPDLKNIIRAQAVVALEKNDFTARIRVSGLDAATQYYYRFVSPGHASAEGAFRTAPFPDDPADVRFVISGDSNLGYTAPRGLDFHVLSAAAAEDPDFFVYFGDTIYADSGVLPTGDAFTLDEYRAVHKLTRADPHLKTLLATTGTYTGWDDHEVRNDYAGETVDPVQFENGAQAFFEYLPVRANAAGPPYRIDRTVRWGEHVELFFLDGRQFRTAERFCNPDPIPDGDETPDTLFSPFVEDEQLAVQVDPVIGPIAAQLLLLPSDPDCVANELADPTREMLGATQLGRHVQDHHQQCSAVFDLRHTLRSLGGVSHRATVAAGLHCRQSRSGSHARAHDGLPHQPGDPKAGVDRGHRRTHRSDDLWADGGRHTGGPRAVRKSPSDLPWAVRWGRGSRQRRWIRPGVGARRIQLRGRRCDRGRERAAADVDRARQPGLSRRSE
jgi:hypothetical protein